MKLIVKILVCYLLLFQCSVSAESQDTTTTEIPVLMYHILIKG